MKEPKSVAFICSRKGAEFTPGKRDFLLSSRRQGILGIGKKVPSSMLELDALQLMGEKEASAKARQIHRLRTRDPDESPLSGPSLCSLCAKQAYTGAHTGLLNRAVKKSPSEQFSY